MYKTVKTVADFTHEEHLAINELKRRMRDDISEELHSNTVVFYRFLKARNFDVNEAEKMVRNMLQWKERLNYDKILEYELPEVLELSFRRSGVCFDKEGSSVHYVAAGKIDLRELYMSARLSDIEKSLFKIFAEEEHYQEEFEKKNIIPPGYVHIMDFEGFSLKQATDMKIMEIFIRLFKEYQDNYPEREKRVYIINISAAFSYAFSIVKHVLAPALQKKLRIYHTDSYKEDLLKVIDEDKLPAFLGGSRKDPDGNPLCLKSINHGNHLLKPYFIHRSKRSLKNCLDVQLAVVPKDSFREIILNVLKKGQYIQWEFETRRHDIGFGIVYRKKGADDDEVLPVQKYYTEEFSEKGEYQCIRTGIYVALFDNTYSWFRTKEVYYKISIEDKEIS